MSVSAASFTFVADLVRRRSAIDLKVGKEYLVESRLLPLVRQAGLQGVDEYVNTLRTVAPGAELDRVVEALTTNETYWFRDVAPFQILTGHVIPALVVDRPHPVRLRVWSAACSTGQEPYSIAMALLDAFPDVSVTITATDISTESLARARAGRYSQREINRGLPAVNLVRHFARDGTSWAVSNEVRSMVMFSQNNLLDPPPAGGPFDIIFLRNVLMYFAVETRARVLRSLRRVLAPDGFLMLGSAETTAGIDDAWERASVERGFVYRIKRDRSSMKALVIDDSRTMRHIVADILGGLGFATSAAADGREALNLLEAGETFDLVCIDWNMPVMDGLEFVLAVRSRPAWRDLTLIMVTTEGEISQVVRALAAGANEYVTKPFTATAISSKLALLGLLPHQGPTQEEAT